MIDDTNGPAADPPVGERLTRIISHLVDTPGAVRVRERPGRSVTVFEVRVDEDDIGQLIGRQGRTARALRTLLDARGSLDGRRYGLEIREY
ncbi:MAG: KH domain-containing protein [Acidobacteriota bacterium]